MTAHGNDRAAVPQPAAELAQFWHWAVTAVGAPSDQRVFQRMACFFGKICDENERLGLIKINEDCAATVVHHFVDCALGLPHIRRLAGPGAAILDVGSGAGLPGVVLALLLPDRRVTLVERSAKKAAFLQAVVEDCALPNVSVVCAQLREVDGPFAVVTGRAVGHFDRNFARSLVRPLRPDGRVVLYKGRLSTIEAELADAGIAKHEIIVLEPPFAKERHLVVFDRAATTGSGATKAGREP